MPRPAEWGSAAADLGPKLREMHEAVGLLLEFGSGVVAVVYDTVGPGAYAVVVRGTDKHPVGGNNLFLLANDVETAVEVPLGPSGR